MPMPSEHPHPGRPRPAGSGPGRARARVALQGPFACEECGKLFERKEYRDKHRRRCIKAATEPRQTRQRSCLACVASKLGCDQKLPSCSRCALRSKECQYASERSIHREESELRHESNPPEPEQVSPVLPRYPTLDNIDSIYPRISPDLEEGMRVPSVDTEMNGASSLPPAGAHAQVLSASAVSGNAYQPWPLDPQLAASQQQQQQQTHSSDGSSLKSANIMSDWIQRSPSQWFMANGDAESTTQWPPRAWPSRSPSISMADAASLPAEWDETFPMSSMGVSNDVNFDLLGSLGILPRNRTTAASHRPSIITQTRPQPRNQHPAPSTTDMRQTDNQQKKPNTEAVNIPANQDQGPSTLHDMIPTTREPKTTTVSPHGEPEQESPPAGCPFHKLTSDQETVQIICSYPRLMIRPGIYPPFVHHKIYPCAEGEILEPLAKAFCCVGAFYASVRTSESFVYSLMNNESRRLVNGFQMWSNSDSNMLAAVHAMCIYQILGFFVSTNAEQTRLAELQQLFFLKMVRKLIQTHLHAGNGEESEKVNWRKWIMNETIRRTVFLANIINTLSYRTQKQNPYYYEALDDDEVARMTLPAPQAVWKASSAEEWIAARSNLSPEEQARSQMTVQMVLDQYTNPQSVSSGGRRGRGRASDRIQLETLDEFTRLVIATARVY